MSSFVRCASNAIGTSSEKNVTKDGFVSLSYMFNEPECMAKESVLEPNIETVAVKGICS